VNKLKVKEIENIGKTRRYFYSTYKEGDYKFSYALRGEKEKPPNPQSPIPNPQSPIK
jgi:hypothetical protein